MNPIDPRRSERALLAAIHRWARTNGWQIAWAFGWVDGALGNETVNIKWSDGEVGVARVIDRLALNGRPVWSCTTWIPVASVGQAVDVLVALDMLPAFLSSSYALAEDRYREQVETLEEDLRRKDRYLAMGDQTIAGLIAENLELRQAAAAVALAPVGGAA